MAYKLPYPPLSAKQKTGFAYVTLKDRLPVILTQVIDITHRQKQHVHTTHGQEGCDDLKWIIGQLSELRYRLVTDKAILPFDSNTPQDLVVWDKCTDEMKLMEGSDPTWFKSTWLYVECYMYRKIAHIFAKSQLLHEWDVFSFQKEQSFVSALPAMTALASDLLAIKLKHPTLSADDKRTSLCNLVWICLWGNRCDLSISVGKQVARDICNPMGMLKQLHHNILADDTKRLVTDYLSTKCLHRIDFILDNAGLEFFSDLCLAELLVETGSCKTIVFHVKQVPWFVSDVTSNDFSWTVEMLQASDIEPLKNLGKLVQSRLDSGMFQVETHMFWTTGYAYREMNRIAPDLYANLAKSGLLIFKGDLNYRKLTSDLAWPHSTSFKESLLGFHPAPLVSLRTLKADTLVGVSEKRVEQCKKETKTEFEWMTTGKYAVVQLDD